MLEREIHIQPILIGKSGGTRGGNVEIQRIVSDISILARNFDAVTTLIDYYGFRKRGEVSVENLECEIKQMALDNLSSNFNLNKIFPYVQKYEFEGLLFSDVTVFAELVMDVDLNVQETDHPLNQSQRGGVEYPITNQST